MDPILTYLRFGDIERPIGGYGVMLALGMCVSVFVAVRAGRRAGMDTGSLISGCGFVAGGGLLGSYVLFLLVEWLRTGRLDDALASGGLVFYGAPIGAFMALWAASGPLGLPLGRSLDATVQAVPVGHAIGRLGCFLGGCCFGGPWEGPLAVLYTHPIAPGAHPSVWRHAAPLYESLGLLVIAAFFILRPAKEVGSGRRVLSYLAAYGVLRFMVELVRGDGVRGLYFGGLVSTSQVLSLLLVIGAAIGLYVLRGRAPMETRP